MLIPDIDSISYYIQYQKVVLIKKINEYLLTMMNHHTDALIDQFEKITKHSIFCIDTYDYRENIDGYPRLRIEYKGDPQPRVYEKMEATLIHHIYQNVDRKLQKQANLTIKVISDTPA